MAFKKNQNFVKAQDGFSLMEMLLVVSLVAMIGLALYKATASGLDIWRRSQENQAQEDTLIFLDKITRELRNTVADSYLSFEGRPGHLLIPTIVEVVPDPHSSQSSLENVRQPGYVEYTFDESSGRILRRMGNYGKSLNRALENPQMMAQVKSLRFHYHFDAGDGAISVRDSVNHIPRGVEVEVEYDTERSSQQFHRYIGIPVGS